MSAVMSASVLLSCPSVPVRMGGVFVQQLNGKRERERERQRGVAGFQRAIGEEIIHSTAGFYHAGVKGQNSVSLWSAEEIKYSSDLETSSHRAPRYWHQNSLAVSNISNVLQDQICAFFFPSLAWAHWYAPWFHPDNCLLSSRSIL